MEACQTLVSNFSKGKKKSSKKSQVLRSNSHKQELFEVEDVLDKRVNSEGLVEYLTKWVGFGFEHCSWEPFEDLKRCKCMPVVQQYEKWRKDFGTKKLTSDEFWVESIQGVQENGSKKLFWVKWWGFDTKFNTWVAEEDLSGCGYLIYLFLNSKKNSPKKKKMSQI